MTDAIVGARTAIALMLSFCSTQALAASVDTTLTYTYDGLLTAGGHSVPDEPIEMAFRLYDVPVGGMVLDNFPDVGAATVTPVGDFFTQYITFNNTDSADHSVWLEVELNGETLHPRQQLAATTSTPAILDLCVLSNETYELLGQVRAGAGNEGGPTLPGDIDMDGDVDTQDFALFSQCFGGANRPPAPTCPPGFDADLDDDGDVDTADFAVFAQNFGSTE